MRTELEQRKKAITMYYYQHRSKSDICRELECTRPWLDRWLSRYQPDHVDESLRDHKSGPAAGTTCTRWTSAIRQQVIMMRRVRSQREKWPYALIGADAIHYELQALNGTEVPPARTIHNWLVQAGVVPPRTPLRKKGEPKSVPIPLVNEVNAIHQLDLKGPLYLRGSSHKYYLAVLRDRYSHRCAITVLLSREAQGIADFLVSSWQWLGLPDYLQMDNALEFRGSNRYPRSFGRIVRVAVDLGVEPLFNPPAEPWRNGGVEHHNGFLEDRLLAIEHQDVEALKKEVKACQDACNQTHRSKSLHGATPDEMIADKTLKLLHKTYQNHQKALSQDRGFVSFIRLVRKSGRITLGANDRFMVNPELAYTYVLARIDLEKKKVVISQENTVLKEYDYSTETIGAWADDDNEQMEKTM